MNLCVGYLLLDEIGSTSLFSSNLSLVDELPQNADIFDEYCKSRDYECFRKKGEETIYYNPIELGAGGLSAYAHCNWTVHLNAISRDSSALRVSFQHPL